MKKCVVVLTVLCVLLFSACTDPTGLATGQVIAVNETAEAGVVSLVVQTETGDVCILVTEDIKAYTWFSNVPVEEVLSGDGPVVILGSVYDNHLKTLTDENGNEFSGYPATKITIIGYLLPEPVTMFDGTKVAVWDEGYNMSYQLEDGTQLLRIDDVQGPRINVLDDDDFNDLSETAQKAVLAYYAQQELLYDPLEELDMAYAAYLESGDQFQAFHVTQIYTPRASNDDLMFFFTELEHIVNGKQGREYFPSTVFDRETGEIIPLLDLFKCDQETLKRTLLDLSGVTDPVLLAEMEAAFRPEYIHFYRYELYVVFPLGTLSGQEHIYTFGLPYDEALGEILYDWAVPTPDPLYVLANKLDRY